MFNEWLGLIFAIVNLSFVLVIYRLFGRTGLFVWVGFSTVLANIQVVKTIEIFHLTATLGNSIYGSAFLVTDILNEKYGKNEAKKAVWIGFTTLLMMTVIMQMVLLFQPSEFDIAHESLETIFSLTPRIAAGSLLAYIISQMLDVYLFSFFKKLFPKDSQFWIRNNGSTMISQLIDTLVFTSVAFIGVYSFDVWMDIFITTYVLKFIIAILDTPFGYMAKRMNKKPLFK